MILTVIKLERPNKKIPFFWRAQENLYLRDIAVRGYDTGAIVNIQNYFFNDNLLLIRVIEWRPDHDEEYQISRAATLEKLKNYCEKFGHSYEINDFYSN